MKDFCHRCGKELEEGALQCPECGALTDRGKNDPYLARQVNAPSRNRMPIVIILVFVSLAAVAILLPMIMPGEPVYDTTVTVMEVSIDDSMNGLYTEGGMAKTFIVITVVNGGTTDLPIGKDNYWIIPTDGTLTTVTENNTFTFKNTGTEPKFTVFLMTYLPNYDKGEGDVKDGDIIDLYAEKNADRVVDNFGATGIVFDMSDVDEDGYVTMEGDAQPLGHVKLKVSVDKV